MKLPKDIVRILFIKQLPIKTTLTNLRSKVPSYKFEIEASKERALSVNKNLTEPTGFVVSGYEVEGKEEWFISSEMRSKSANTAIHLTRHRRITTPMGSLLPQLFAGR